MSIHLQTVLQAKNVKNEVAAVSVLVNSHVSMDGPTRSEKSLQNFTLVRKLEGSAFPLDLKKMLGQPDHKKLNVELHDNERSLLSQLIARIQLIDPDVIVGHNFLGFTLDVLLHRMGELKVAQWSRIGRLRRSVMPRLQTNIGGMSNSSHAERMVMAGRLVCDTYLVSKELLMKETSYTLSELSRTQLGKRRLEISSGEVASRYRDASSLCDLLHKNEYDAFLTLSLMFKLNALPLMKQITNLAGNLLSRTLVGARAERVEYVSAEMVWCG